MLRRLSAGRRGSLAVVISTRPTGWLADSLRLLAACYARVLAVHVIDAAVPPASATRTGRVLWVTVKQADELAATLSFINDASQGRADHIVARGNETDT